MTSDDEERKARRCRMLCVYVLCRRACVVCVYVVAIAKYCYQCINGDSDARNVKVRLKGENARIITVMQVSSWKWDNNKNLE